MKWRLAVLAVLAVFAIGGFVAGWYLYKRPLAVYAWGTRRALTGAGLRRETVTSAAGPQCVFVGGKGPVLVLLHGAGDQAGTWFRVVPTLAKRFTLVVPDLAGHGDSAPARGPIDVSAVVAGVEEVVERYRGGDAVTVAGNSLGAWMAMVYARRHPERVTRVVAINGGAMRGTNAHAVVVPRTREEARASVAQTRDASSAPIPGYVLDDIVREARVGPLARFAATAATMDAWVLDEAQLRGLETPVQLIWGTSDRLMPLAYAEQLRAAVPNATLVTIDRCGHVPQVECPLALLKVFKESLDPALELPGSTSGTARP